MGATFNFFPIADDDPVLALIETIASPDRDPSPHDVWEGLEGLDQRNGAYDDWRGLSMQANDLIGDVAAVPDREMLWTDGARALDAEGAFTYLPAPAVAQAAHRVDDVGIEDLRQAAFAREMPRSERDGAVEVAVAIIEVLRFARAQHLGVLVEFTV